MWSAVWKVLGGSLLTFALVWALVLGWWQSNDHEPTRLELGLYLAALPLALVGGYLLLRGFIDHLKAPAVVAPRATPALRDDDPLALASAKSEAAERGFSIALLEAYVLTSAGASADDTLAAVEGGKRPEPSSRLTDEAGFPVFVGEVPELDVDAMVERTSAESGPLRELASHERVMRSFSLLERMLEVTSDKLREIIDQAGDSINLRVVWLVPAAWKNFDLVAMKVWLQAGLSSFPFKSKPEITVLPVSSELESLLALDNVTLRANRDPLSHELTLLLGAVSAVDEQSVGHRAAANRLFTSKHQEGQIPGEGGVAMLLAAQPLIERLKQGDCILLSRVSAASRDKPVDSGGRVSGKLINQLTTGLLDVTGIEHAAIKTAILDTDHRTNNLTEALEGLGQGFEHLDPIKDCLAVGASTGDLSPIGGLVALACARARVLSSEAPALCISNQHPLARGVVLAMPILADADINPSST